MRRPWPRRDQSSRLFGNIVGVVSRLTGKLCRGPSHVSVLSAPCCCGFHYLSPLPQLQHVKPICVCVCLALDPCWGFVKPDPARPSQRSGAQTGSPLGLVLYRLTFELQPPPVWPKGNRAGSAFFCQVIASYRQLSLPASGADYSGSAER